MLEFEFDGYILKMIITKCVNENYLQRVVNLPESEVFRNPRVGRLSRCYHRIVLGIGFNVL